MSKLKKPHSSDTWHAWRAGRRENMEVNKKRRELIRTKGVELINEDDSHTVSTVKTSSNSQTDLYSEALKEKVK